MYQSLTLQGFQLLTWMFVYRDFSWSPGDNIITFWVPEDKDIPARVTLMQLPSRQEIRVRNLFNVVDCKLHWQRNGDYLCVKVDRTPKGTQVQQRKGGTTGLGFKIKWNQEILNVIFESFQGVVTNFEIFRMREKQVPVDVFEMKGENGRKAGSTSEEHQPEASFHSHCFLYLFFYFIYLFLFRKHHCIRLGAQRQQVCCPPWRVSKNQRLFLSCEK